MQINIISSDIFFERNIKGGVKGEKVLKNDYHNIYAFFEQTSDI